MKSLVWFLVVFSVLLSSCVSTNKSREEYFGYNNEPKYEEKKKTSETTSTPYVYSYENKHNQKKDESSNNPSVIIYNYYPYPLDPRYVPYDRPYDFDFFLFYGDRYYDPFWDYYVIVVPYNRRDYYLHYPHHCWDYYWWERRPRVIYVPYDYKDEKPRERTVRDFGPSRGVVDDNRQSTPTKEPRSGSRHEPAKKSIVRPDEPNKNTSEPVKLTLPEKSSTPKETPKTETPKSEPNTKQERSSTRPR
ncbi:MAG: hypothetical protein WHV60_05125 [Bacteroidota bacterium]